MKHIVLILLGVLAIVLVAGAAWLWTPDLPRATLEARYFDAHSSYVDVDGVRLHVRASGPKSAPVVIMLHGFGASLHTWEPWAEALSADHRVVRFDLPGFGLTGADPGDNYSDERSVGLLVALMDKLGITRASLVGNSIGGRIAWRFAAEHPGRVDKLVLVSPDGFASPGFEYGKAPAIPAAFRLLPYALPRSMLRMNLARAYANPQQLSEATLTRYHDLMRAPDVRRATIARTEQTILVPPESLLQKIAAPTLLVWGDQDAMIPVTNAADYARAMPASRLVTLPNLGHVPQEEAPAASLAPVRAFLAR